VGFFNLQSPLGGVLSGLFAERHWEPSFGVTNPACVEAQLDRVAGIVALAPRPCPNARCDCHIGYVHLRTLPLYSLFAGGVLERIPAERPLWSVPAAAFRGMPRQMSDREVDGSAAGGQRSHPC
jgi:hypothetical protein